MRLKILFAVAAVALAGCARRAQEQRSLSPSAAIAEGWENYRLSEFELAQKSFEQAAAESPQNSDIHWQAMYGLATTWNLRRPGEDRKKAEELYRQIESATTNGDLVAWTALALARMKHLVPVGTEPDIAAVRREYEDVIAKHQGHLAAKEALIYEMATFLATLKEEDSRYAVARLKMFVEEPGAHAFVQPAWSLMAVGFTTLKMPEERLNAEIQALKNYEVDPGDPSVEFAWAYWNIAAIAEFECGDFATARDYYRRLLREYPHDIKVYGAKQALARMDALEAKLRAEAGGTK